MRAWYIVWGAVFIHLVQSIRTIALTDGLQPNFSNNGSFLVMVADVYSYAEDDTVEDPLLAEHLAHFGIDFSALRKVQFSLFSGMVGNHRALTFAPRRLPSVFFCK